jgi:hypothetical protein
LLLPPLSASLLKLFSQAFLTSMHQ